MSMLWKTRSHEQNCGWNVLKLKDHWVAPFNLTFEDLAKNVRFLTAVTSVVFTHLFMVQL